VEEKLEVNNTSQGGTSVSTTTSSSQSRRQGVRTSMVNQDSTLRLPTFHGMGRDDAEQHWFTCEAIWSVKRVTDEASKIVQLETTFRDKALTWYMKYKATASVGQARSLTR
jgi:hypothetical protein